jgi:anti-sigma factor RsiW
MTRRHVDDLFTAAHDDDLSAIDDARFHAHIRSCKDCSAAFAEFTATVEALRELPKARLARPIHLPSTPPVADRSGRPRISLDWLSAGLLRRFPATAIAGAAAVVLIIVALVHNGSGVPTGTLSTAAGSDHGAGSAAAPAIATPATNGQGAACTPPVTAVTGASPPVSFSAPQVITSPNLPGARLVLAASALSVNPGQSVTLYAQLSLPVASLGAPGTTGVAPVTRAVRPCVSVGVGNSSQVIGTTSGALAGGEFEPGVGSPNALHPSTGAATLLGFTVPRGLAPGTELHVVASIPAGFEAPGSPALTATLTLTTT